MHTCIKREPLQQCDHDCVESHEASESTRHDDHLKMTAHGSKCVCRISALSGSCPHWSVGRDGTLEQHDDLSHSDNRGVIYVSYRRLNILYYVEFELRRPLLGTSKVNLTRVRSLPREGTKGIELPSVWGKKSVQIGRLRVWVKGYNLTHPLVGEQEGIIYHESSMSHTSPQKHTKLEFKVRVGHHTFVFLWDWGMSWHRTHRGSME